MGQAELQGVRPVEMPMPFAATTIRTSAERITPERPFRPVLYDFTDTLVIPIKIAWLLLLVWLVGLERKTIARIPSLLRTTP